MLVAATARNQPCCCEVKDVSQARTSSAISNSITAESGIGLLLSPVFNRLVTNFLGTITEKIFDHLYLHRHILIPIFNLFY